MLLTLAAVPVEAATKAPPILIDGGLFGVRSAMQERHGGGDPVPTTRLVALAQAGGASDAGMGETTAGETTAGDAEAGDGGSGESAAAGGTEAAGRGGAAADAPLPIAFRSLTAGPCHVSRFARGTFDPNRCGPAARLSGQGPLVASAGFASGGAGVSGGGRAVSGPGGGGGIAPVPLPAAGWLLLAGTGALLLGRRLR